MKILIPLSELPGTKVYLASGYRAISMLGDSHKEEVEMCKGALDFFRDMKIQVDADIVTSGSKPPAYIP